MKLIKTSKQLTLENQLSKLKILREIDKRNGLNQYKELKNEFKRLVKGDEGEQTLVEYLKNYGNPQWHYLRNVWFDYFGEFEIDLLLITYTGLYAFEVKNYTGKYELLNTQCLRNSEVIGYNAFSQAQKLTVNFKNMLNKNSHNNIHGVLAFVGENNNVHVHDELTGIKVLMRNELQNYIWKIVQKEKNHPGYPIDIESFLKKIESFDVGKASKQKEIRPEVKANVQKGICCSHCGRFDLNTKTAYIICSCGMHEPREEAIVRTICEYGVIHYEKYLTTSALTHFFGGDISESTVFRHLNKHFERIGSGKTTRYINKQSLLKEIQHEFALNPSKWLRLG